MMAMSMARHMRERAELRPNLTLGDVLRTIAARATQRTYALPTTTPQE